jgi:hypothetical protein
MALRLLRPPVAPLGAARQVRGLRPFLKGRQKIKKSKRRDLMKRVGIGIDEIYPRCRGLA